jgi:hypothetical protein
VTDGTLETEVMDGRRARPSRTSPAQAAMGTHETSTRTKTPRSETMIEKMLLILLMGLGYALCETGVVEVEKSEKTGTPATTARAQSGGSVDCKRLCRRTFDQCLTEVMLASGKMTAKQIQRVKQVGAMSQMKKKGYEACLKDCSRKGGKGPDAAKINKCLGHKSCTAYAQCIKKHL